MKGRKEKIYEAIISYSPGGVCVKSRKELAAEFGFTRRTVGYYIDELAARGKLVKKGAAIHVPGGGAGSSLGFMVEGKSMGERLKDKDEEYLEEVAAEAALVDEYHEHADSGIIDLLSVDPKVWFLVLMLAQTVHTFKFVFFVSGADWWSGAYAFFTCIGMDFVTYTFVVKGEKYKVQSMKFFYVLANVYAFNVGLFGDMMLSADLFWEVIPNGRFWISLIPSFYIPHMAVKFSEWVYKNN